jgi:glycosyltransferase involved in cell wall biosynthesis
MGEHSTSADRPAVDVILPTHARPHTIGCSIAAVLAQTYSNLTLHVVGDGCSEETARIVKSIDDPRVVLHPFPKARGYGYANRNAVLQSLGGDIVAYSSDDDLWFPDHLEHGVRCLDESKLDYVITRSIHVRSDGNVDPNFFAFDWHFPAVGTFLHNWFHGALTMVHRRSVFDTVGYWNEDLVRFGDRELYARCRRSGLRGEYRDIPTILRFYAQDWDHLYPGLREPPQTAWLARIADPAWRREMRHLAEPGPRSLASRRRQWHDMLRFVRKSGLKFLRFQFERRRSGTKEEGALAQ